MEATSKLKILFLCTGNFGVGCFACMTKENLTGFLKVERGLEFFPT